MPASRLRTLRPPPAAGLLARLRLPSLARRGAPLAAGIGVLTVMATTGDLLSPVLRHRSPLLLMLLTPRTPYMVAAAADVPLAVFILAAMARLCAADPLHFMVGRTAGPAGLAAVSRLAARGRPRFVRPLAQLAERAPTCTSHPLWLVGVAATPTAKAMVLTGAAGVRARPVALANVAGTLLRVVVVWQAGRSFPALAATCAAVAPWVVVPAVSVGALLGAVRWQRKRTSARDAAVVTADDVAPAQVAHPAAAPDLDSHTEVTPFGPHLVADATAAA